MRLNVYQWENGRWSVIREGDRYIETMSYSIAQFLKIRERDYDSVLEGITSDDASYYYYDFETREEAQNFLDKLEAFAIMKKLTNL